MFKKGLGLIFLLIGLVLTIHLIYEIFIYPHWLAFFKELFSGSFGVNGIVFILFLMADI